MTAIDWKQQYALLEAQMEATLLKVADVLERIEGNADGGRSYQTTLHMREGTTYVVAHATGADEEYAFYTYSGGEGPTKHPYGPMNSIAVLPGVDRVRVFWRRRAATGRIAPTERTVRIGE